MGKHAYLILAHTNFGQLRKLIEMLDHPLNDIYIHVDKKANNFNPKEWEDITKFSKLIFIPKRRKVNWGGVSIMRVELDLLEAATSQGKYDYYHLLSGMDMPIKSQDYIHEFFEKNKGKEFVNLWELRQSTLSRFYYYTVFPEGERPFYTRLVNHFFKGLQMMAGFKINRDVHFHYGSQWFSITDDFARYVMSHRDWLEKVFRHTSTCDEIFLPTLLCNSPFKNNLNDPTVVKDTKEINLSNMRFIDWSRGESIRHPWTFTEDDYPLLEKTPHLWARKFDEKVDSKIIDKLYHKFKQ